MIDQTYVDTNSCTSIEIADNVSTTWSGTVDLGGGTVTVLSGNTMTMGDASVMTLGAADDFVVQLGATTTHAAQSPAGIEIHARNITVDGSIDASGKGCAGNTGPDLETGICTDGASGYGRGFGGSGAPGMGASYGGIGGGFDAGSRSPVYGSSTHPILLGSGGGNGYFVAGATGGGKIALTLSGALTVNGSILANGSNGTLSPWGGGAAGSGSGGSILITAPTIGGSGIIHANGGNAGSWGGGSGGAGGGGRIAVYYYTLSGLDASTQMQIAAGSSVDGILAAEVGSLYLWSSNSTPDAPSSIAPSFLMDGSTTGTNTLPPFTFILSDSDLADTVRYRIQIDNDADFSSPVIDYTSGLAAQGPTSFEVGQATGSGVYTAGSFGQTLADGSYYWRVRTTDVAFASSLYVTANSGAVAFTIDTAPRDIQFQHTIASGDESVTATSVKLILNTPSFLGVTVHYALSGTATGGGVDYTLAAGDATIPAGETSTTIPLAIVDDAIAETDETVVLTLSSPTNAALGVNNTFTYMILDNDAVGVTLSKTTAAVTEGGATDSYTAVLTSEPTSTVIIALSTNAQLALSTSTLYFTNVNWNTPQAVTIAATDDAIYEGDHSASITHTASSTNVGYNASTTIGSILVRITDNDSPPRASGGGGGGAVGGIGAIQTLPLPPSIPVVLPVVPLPSVIPPITASTTLPVSTSTDRVPSTRVVNLVRQDFRAFTIVVDQDVLRSEASFIEFGSNPLTMSLGEGERRAIFRDLLDIQRRIPTIVDQERLAAGQVPLVRNLAQEKKLLVRVRPTFRAIFGHDPRFSDATEARAWNILVYRLRVPRDLARERAAVLRFNALFKRNPVDAFQWAAVRALEM